MIALLQADAKRIPLADGSIDMIFTDPPYVKDLVHTYQYVADEAMRLLKPGGFVAVMAASTAVNRIMRWFDDAGLNYYWLYTLSLGDQFSGVAWKNSNGHGMPVTFREKFVLAYSSGESKSRTQTVGRYVGGSGDKRFHHWGQSVDSHRYYIDCFSYPGDLILDPMCGGGTTAIAASILGRRCILSDIDPVALATTARRLASPETVLTDMPLFETIT